MIFSRFAAAAAVIATSGTTVFVDAMDMCQSSAVGMQCPTDDGNPFKNLACCENKDTGANFYGCCTDESGMQQGVTYSVSITQLGTPYSADSGAVNCELGEMGLQNACTFGNPVGDVTKGIETPEGAMPVVTPPGSNYCAISENGSECGDLYHATCSAPSMGGEFDVCCPCGASGIVPGSINGANCTPQPQNGVLGVNPNLFYGCPSDPFGLGLSKGETDEPEMEGAVVDVQSVEDGSAAASSDTVAVATFAAVAFGIVTTLL